MRGSATLSAMRSVCALFALTCLAATEDQQFNGRWDIAVSGDARAKAWWLEVSGAGSEAVKGKFVGAPGGQLDDIPKITISDGEMRLDRKSTRLNSSHANISYAVFCLKK